MATCLSINGASKVVAVSTKANKRNVAPSGKPTKEIKETKESGEEVLSRFVDGGLSEEDTAQSASLALDKLCSDSDLRVGAATNKN